MQGSKKAVTNVEKKDENGAGENNTAREVKAVSPEELECDQEGSNQSVVVSSNSTIELLFPINKMMNIRLLNAINCAPYYQSP